MNLKVVENPQTLDGLRVIQEIDEVVNTLKQGECIARYERGDSMQPILVSGQYARLTPLRNKPKNGDAVFCCVNGHWMTHMVWVSNEDSGQCLIGSTSGQLYGWTNEILALAQPMPYIEKEHETLY